MCELNSEFLIENHEYKIIEIDENTNKEVPKDISQHNDIKKNTDKELTNLLDNINNPFLKF